MCILLNVYRHRVSCERDVDKGSSALVLLQLRHRVGPFLRPWATLGPAEGLNAMLSHYPTACIERNNTCDIQDENSTLRRIARH